MDKVDFESPSVQSYLTILQSVIGRMASNSSSCKTWCITLVSAIVVIITDKAHPDYVWISLVPITLFLVLDAYYLALERQFRDVYNSFIRKLHSGSATVDDVFIVAPRAGVTSSSASILKAAGSMSVWPFYLLLAAMLVAVRLWVL
ncbi:hypothetical protein FBR04_01335 [Betaproteobacteria bacterium PRO7]|jgi:hypothetical protein|nr:hypothetical protein [Betaproteobacteria bacterium PRO7]